MLFNANGSFLYYKYNYCPVDDYYQNIVKLIQQILKNNPELNINILLCDNYNFNNSNKTLNININYEHTLVKSGGRDIPNGTPFGDVTVGIPFGDPGSSNEKYLVRIDNYDILNNSDIIIDYSNPNIHNVKTCSNYNSFSKKHIYNHISKTYTITRLTSRF